MQNVSFLLTNLILYERRKNKAIGVYFDTREVKLLFLYYMSLENRKARFYSSAVFLREYTKGLAKKIESLVTQAVESEDTDFRRSTLVKVVELQALYSEGISKLEGMANV
jgi:hypothetical protein